MTSSTGRRLRRHIGALVLVVTALAAGAAGQAGAQASDPPSDAPVLSDPPGGAPEGTGGCAGWSSWAPEPADGAPVALGEQQVTMSDGATLAVDVTLPAGDGPFPAVVSITGYGKGTGFSNATGFATHGYAQVAVDDRGTGASSGQWSAWDERTQADYPEVVDWIVAQPWSDGRLALEGSSYGGITALLAAASGHEAVEAVFATIPMGDAYRDITFAGAQVNVAFIPLWMGLVTGLGVANALGDPAVLAEHLAGAPAFQASTVLEATLGGDLSFDGPFWRLRSPLEVIEDVRAPTFIVGGLDDIFQRGEPLLYEALADHTDARLLIGPWAHINAGEGLPRDGVPSLGALRLQWFDEHVKDLDTSIRCLPPVLQYVRGAEEYRAAASWPVPDLRAERWYLGADGSLATRAPARAGQRTYLQLPISGPCTRSTHQWLIGVMAGTPCETDNRLDESLPVSLTYTSQPFDAPVEVNGPIQADLWVRPSGTEAVVSVAVSDVAPDGTSRGLTNGLLLASRRAEDPDRARRLDGQSIQPWHHFTAEHAAPLVPGQPVRLAVEVFPTAAVIQPGHRLRITVAPYDVPHALPPAPVAAATLAGSVDVLSGPRHPSSVVLPVVATPAPEPPQEGGLERPPAAAERPASASGGTLPRTGGAGVGLLPVLLLVGAASAWRARASAAR